ncbi:helix-turn-helix domain-containing protein [Clostridium sp. BJN0013]|uniref:helix-turn-helix domain-containing protein n=1 Tax=Clostridium sp. BJN0013 TaxID=3236840 RepID=UPI0034C666E5
MKIIKLLRQEKNISQNKLARIAGISQSLLSDIESDKVSPTIDKLKSISQALQVPVSKLLELDETDSTQKEVV